MSSPTFRRKILTAAAGALEIFTVEKGDKDHQWFRQVKRGMLTPLGQMRPTATVSDGGQRRVTDDEAENSTTRILTVAITLQLAEDWAKVEAVDAWTDRVEQIIALLHKRLAAGAGVLKCEYVDDDPVDVAFMSGATNAAWQIQIEVTYFVDAVQM